VNIPQDKIDNFEELVRKSPNGMSCSFVAIDDEWGLKCYDEEDVRDEAYNNQQLLADYELAPPVGQKTEVGEYYCYFSRIAEVICPNFADSELFDKKTKEWEDRINDLTDEINSKTGIYVADDHVENFGVFNGKLVLIDTEGLERS
jgi:hypothetical protein